MGWDCTVKLLNRNEDITSLAFSLVPALCFVFSTRCVLPGVRLMEMTQFRQPAARPGVRTCEGAFVERYPRFVPSFLLLYCFLVLVPASSGPPLAGLGTEVLRGTASRLPLGRLPPLASTPLKR